MTDMMKTKRDYAEQLVDAIVEAAILRAVQTYLVTTDDSVRLRYNAAREMAIELIITGEAQ